MTKGGLERVRPFFLVGRGEGWVDRFGLWGFWLVCRCGRAPIRRDEGAVRAQTIVARLGAAYDLSTRWLTSLVVGEARQTARGRHPRPGERLPAWLGTLGPIHAGA